MTNHESHSNNLPYGVQVVAFVLILVVLWAFTDTFTAIIGTALEIALFAGINTPAKV
jgi:hypothetical protein